METINAVKTVPKENALALLRRLVKRRVGSSPVLDYPPVDELGQLRLLRLGLSPTKLHQTDSE